MMKSLAVCAALVVASFVAPPPVARAADAAATDTRPHQEQVDAAIVQRAFAELPNGGPLALQSHVPALRQVLEHAPSNYPAVVREGDITIVRTNGPEGLSPELLAGGLAGVAGGKGSTLRIDFNTYPAAALLLGSFAVEAQRPDLALPYLDRGLALQPDEPNLVTEKAHALYRLNRTAEGLSLVQAWLAAHPLGSDKDRARMLRSKGFALTELARLDDAEEAYEASLKLEPNHALALNELKYIRGLKNGAPKSSIQSTTSDKAAREAPAPTPPPAAKQPT